MGGVVTGACALTSGCAPCALRFSVASYLGGSTVFALIAALVGGLIPLTNGVLFAGILTRNYGAGSAASLAGSVPHAVDVVVAGGLVGVGKLTSDDADVLAYTTEGILGALVEHLGEGLGGVVSNHDGGAAGAALALGRVPHAQGVLVTGAL